MRPRSRAPPICCCRCQELGARCVVALTLVDEAAAAAPDAKALGALLGCEVVAVTARTGKGLDELRAAIDRMLRGERRPLWRWTPSPALRAHLDAIALPESWRTSTRYGTALPAADDALALWALTCIEPRTGSDDDELEVPAELRAAVTARTIERSADDEGVLARWVWLDREIPKLLRKRPDRSRTQSIDRLLLHRGFGFVAFIAVMAIVFMSLFWGADPMIDAIDHCFKALGEEVRHLFGAGIFTDFIVDGVIGGVGAVMVFLPQILLLFLFLGFLEDCGYLARVAYLMDRIMRSMNLHGRAFVPMLSGFACAVPAILATRTMERRRDRILTMMVVPLMTCSARLPVYTLIIGALIPRLARDAGPADGRHVPVQRDDRADRGVGDVEVGQAAQGEAPAVPDRAAAVSLAALARRAADDVGQVERVPQGGGDRDPRLLDRAVGAALLPARAARGLAGLRRDDRARSRGGQGRRSRMRSRRRSSRTATAAGSVTRSSPRSRRSASTGRSASASSARSPRARCSSRRSASSTQSVATRTKAPSPCAMPCAVRRSTTARAPTRRSSACR